MIYNDRCVFLSICPPFPWAINNWPDEVENKAIKVGFVATKCNNNVEKIIINQYNGIRLIHSVSIPYMVFWNI